MKSSRSHEKGWPQELDSAIACLNAESPLLSVGVKLDCETPESTARSVAHILGLEVGKMDSRLGEITEKDFQPNEDVGTDRWLPMVNSVAGFDVEDIESGNTFWFHATRVKNFDLFRSGIYPLTRQLDETWHWLHSMVADNVSSQEWDRFRRDTENDHYGRSQMVNEAWMSATGPFAFLIAEATLKPGDTGNHDYFAISELVEDISGCFARKYRVSLKDRHHAATKPGLIKFITPGIKALHLGAALDYLLYRKHGWSLCCLSPCYSGEGRPVSSEQIVKAIPVNQSARLFRGRPQYTLSDSNVHVTLESKPSS